MFSFKNLPMVSKVVLPLAMLGTLGVLIVIYSLIELRDVDRNYRLILDRDAAATLLISDAQGALSDAGKLVFSVLTMQESRQMRASRLELELLQADFIRNINDAFTLLPQHTEQLNRILNHQSEWFTYGAEVIEWAARWRGDRALKLIDERLAPLSSILDTEISALRNDAVRQYQLASEGLSARARNTLIESAVATGFALIFFVGLSVYLSVTYISRPINALTRAMGRLTARNFGGSIPYAGQSDEIGQMAKALDIFNRTIQKAELLERKALADAHAREIAERTAKEKSAFLAIVSHEIRTPLNAIIVLTRLVLKEPLQPSQAIRLERINTASRHLLAIINDILDFSKIDAGRLQLDVTRANPEILLADVMEMMEDKARDKQLTLQTLLKGPMPDLLTDPLRITQILVNYISNAIKFSPRQGHIKVSLELLGGGEFRTLYGQVEDEGPGLAPEQIDRLFQPFQQADASTSRQHGGTGLGLAICRSLAELMNGRVGVVSEPGLGSYFWFEVNVQVAPVTAHDICDEASEARRAPAIALQGLRLLLVDDNEMNRTVGQDLLTQAGLQVELASSGQEAIDLLKRQSEDYYCAVLMDIMMPGMNGLETTRLIRDMPGFESLPIIALSANTSRLDQEECFNAGMNGHTGKPINEDALWEVLLNSIETGSARRSGPAGTSEKPFNEKVLLDMQQRISIARVEQLLPALISEYQRHSNAMLSALRTSNFDAVVEHAHDLCSASGHLGLEQITRLCKSILEDARNGNSIDLSALTNDFEALSDHAQKGLSEWLKCRSGHAGAPGQLL